MSIFGPPASSTNSKDHNAKGGSNWLAKTGGSLSGHLNMGGYEILNIPEPRDLYFAANKLYVDKTIQQMIGTVKPIITIWAEESGSVDAGKKEWSFGNGANGTGHGYAGYVMLASGRITRMGIVSAQSNGQPAGYMRVVLLINGRKAQSFIDGRNVIHGINKEENMHAATYTYPQPIEVSRGSVLNFETEIGSKEAASSLVCALLELDM